MARSTDLTIRHATRNTLAALVAGLLLAPVAIAQSDAQPNAPKPAQSASPASKPATDKPKEPAKQPERDPEPPTEMPTPPLDEVGDPGVPFETPADTDKHAPDAADAKQPAPDAPGAAAGAPSGRDRRGQSEALRGPGVGNADVPRLTRRDFSGRIRRLDIFPGEAALDYLKVDHRTQVRINAIVNERSAILDRIVRENIELALRVLDARQRGDNAMIPVLGREFRDVASELTSRGSTAQEVMSILPVDQRRDYEQMLDSYWSELRDQMLTEARQRGDSTTFRQIIDREVDRIWAGEVKRSYERQIGQRAIDFEQIVNGLGLDETALGKCREEIETVYAKRPKNSETGVPRLGPDERRDLYARIFKVLSPESQRRLAKEVLALPPIREKSIEELAKSLPAEPAKTPAPKPAAKPNEKTDDKPAEKPVQKPVAPPDEMNAKPMQPAG
ncbi:MAG: hypothetical protein SFY96_06070 [Planctomycetota bacterium]|nr:hypothetical protein [Planctomycetota bacterium]